MALRLRVRGNGDGVEGAVIAVCQRLPDGWPGPSFRGRVLVVPLHPEAIEYLRDELLERGYRDLARRLIDPVRWKERA